MDQVQHSPAPVQDRMRLLLRSVHDLGGLDDLGTVLQRTVDLACQVTGARYGAIGVVGDGDVSRFSHFITSGLTDAEHALLGDPPRGRGILGRLIREPGPVRVADLTREADAVGFPPGHPAMHTFLGMPVRIGSQVFGNLYLTEKAGGASFTEQDELLLEGLASLAGAVIDTVRRRLEAGAQGATVEAVRAVNRALLTQDDPSLIVPLVTDQAVRVTGAQSALVVVPTAAGVEALEILAASGADLDIVLSGLHARIAQVLASGTSQHRAERESRAVLDHQAGPRHTSIVPVRLRDGGQVVLVVAGWRLATAVPPRLTEALIESLADQVGLVLDRVRSTHDHDALVTLADRDRIARDLHDLVIQRLFAAGLTLQGATRLDLHPEVLQRIEGTISELDATIRDIRATIFALTPTEVGTSLRGQVRDLVGRYADNLGFVPTLRFTGPVDSALEADSRSALLMVLREALSNVARHAGAGSVHVDLTAQEHRLVMVVTDDGVGLPPRVVESGLGNARRRAFERGGTMDLLAHTPSGTVLRWQVPLRQ